MEEINGTPSSEAWQAHARSWAMGYKAPYVDCADLALPVLIMFCVYV